ncbi:hypothetical protein [Sphingomicrobium arenosum]|uniref:hypothetical protein n=1 Tax=Sphingomicrobium arenosum TaxID=2233861 RepID=UPI0022403F36|nr:hypothetical protein [Sphingomicrobium arenosum]
MSFLAAIMLSAAQPIDLAECWAIEGVPDDPASDEAFRICVERREVEGVVERFFEVVKAEPQGLFDKSALRRLFTPSARLLSFEYNGSFAYKVDQLDEGHGYLNYLRLNETRLSPMKIERHGNVASVWVGSVTAIEGAMTPRRILSHFQLISPDGSHWVIQQLSMQSGHKHGLPDELVASLEDDATQQQGER